MLISICGEQIDLSSADIHWITETLKTRLVISGEEIGSNAMVSASDYNNLRRSVGQARNLLTVIDKLLQTRADDWQRLVDEKGSITVEVDADDAGVLNETFTNSEVEQTILKTFPHFTGATVAVMGQREGIKELGLYTVVVSGVGAQANVKLWVVPTPGPPVAPVASCSECKGNPF